MRLLIGFILGVATTTSVGLLLNRIPTTQDAIMWRLTALQPFPGYVQRSVEAQLHGIQQYTTQSVPVRSIVLFGDSHLRRLPQKETHGMINLAIGGQTLHSMTRQLPQYKFQFNEQILVIGGGTNDLLGKRAASQISADWQEIAQSFRRFSKVICVGIPSGLKDSPFKEEIGILNRASREICEGKGAVFIPIDIGQGAFKLVESETDGIHLSPQGELILAQLIAQAAQ